MIKVLTCFINFFILFYLSKINSHYFFYNYYFLFQKFNFIKYINFLKFIKKL
jgi:hypothetical protein